MEIKVNNQHYEKGSEKYDRVTAILKQLPGQDFSAIPEKILENARERGNSYHFYLEQIATKNLSAGMLDGIKSKDIEMHGTVKLLNTWFIENVKKVILCEKPLLSEKYKIGGTPDIFVTTKNKINTLIDLKCTFAISPVHIIQLAGYNILLKENKYKPVKYLILHIHDNKIKQIPVSDNNIRYGERVFLQTLALSRTYNQFKGAI